MWLTQFKVHIPKFSADGSDLLEEKSTQFRDTLERTLEREDRDLATMKPVSAGPLLTTFIKQGVVDSAPSGAASKPDPKKDKKGHWKGSPTYEVVAVIRAKNDNLGIHITMNYMTPGWAKKFIEFLREEAEETQLPKKRGINESVERFQTLKDTIDCVSS